MAPQHVFEDAYGEVIDHPNKGFIEIRWYDTTAEMTAPELQRWLSNFADLIERSASRRVLVDSTSFKMDSMDELMDWRYEVIIPRYNELGVSKFAFHLPTGSPPIGGRPIPEGPANFPTGYFASRVEATEWLAT